MEPFREAGNDGRALITALAIVMVSDLVVTCSGEMALIVSLMHLISGRFRLFEADSNEATWNKIAR